MIVTRRERFEPKRTNEAWSMDFVADGLTTGQHVRALTIVDVFSREALAIRSVSAFEGRMSSVSAIGALRSVGRRSGSSSTTAASFPAA